MKLETLLREDARAKLPEDDGFTARVMARLPASAAASSGGWKAALVLGSAGMGSVLAWALAPADSSLVRGFLDVVRLDLATPGALLGLGIGGALLASALVLATEE